DEDGHRAQQRVAAAVVEVQMAVRGQADVADRHSGGIECRRQRDAAGAVVRVHLGGGAETGVEDDRRLWMFDEVAQARLDPRSARPGLLRRAYEVTEVDPSN